MLGSSFQGFFDELAGLAEFHVVFRPHIAQVIEGLGKVRRKPEASLKVVLGFGQVARALAGGAELEQEVLIEPFRVFGFGDNLGAIEVLHGPGIVLILAVSQAGDKLQDEVLGIAGELLARRLEGGHGLAGLLEVQLRGCQVIVGLLEVRAQEDGFAEMLRSLVPFFVLKGQGPQVVVGGGVGGVLLDDGLELLDGVFVVGGAQVDFREHGVDALARGWALRATG